MTSKEKKQLKFIEQVLKDFPKVVREKRRRGLKRIAFSEKTFGPLVKQLQKELKK